MDGLMKVIWFLGGVIVGYIFLKSYFTRKTYRGIRLTLINRLRLYLLERQRRMKMDWLSKNDQEAIRQGIVTMKGEVSLVSTPFGLQVPFIVKEDVVFIRRTEFIEALKVIGDKLDEMNKVDNNANYGNKLKTSLIALDHLYEFRKEWEVLRPFEFRDLYTLLTCKVFRTLSDKEQTDTIYYFDTIYKYW